MTAALLSAKAPAYPARLRESLREIHARSLKDVHGLLDPALRHEAGPWIRWAAVHTLEKTFFDRFEQEHAVTESLAQEIGSGLTVRLWVGAELIIVLRWQLNHEPGLCHRPGEFSILTSKLMNAIEHWFRQVEDALGELRWADLPAGVRQALSELNDAKEATHVAHS